MKRPDILRQLQENDIEIRISQEQQKIWSEKESALKKKNSELTKQLYIKPVAVNF